MSYIHTQKMSLSKQETKKWKGLVTWGNKEYYPSRPADEEIALYSYELKNRGKKGSKVLVLGATAALRDISLDEGMDVIAVDYNKKIIKQMDSYMSHKPSSKNKTIHGNWLTIPFDKDSFDFIIGDASFNNIDWKDYEKLLKSMNQWIKPSGYIIQRLFVYRPELKQRKPENIVKEYRRTKKWRDLKYNIRLHSPLSMSKAWYNPKNHKAPWKPFFEYQEQLYGQGILRKDEFDKIHAEAHALVSTFPTMQAWEKILKKHFKIHAKQRAKEFSHTKFAPVYIAKAKKPKSI